MDGNKETFNEFIKPPAVHVDFEEKMIQVCNKEIYLDILTFYMSVV